MTLSSPKGKSMRVVISTLFLSALLLTGFAQAGQVSPGLEAQMAERSADNQYKTLLILEDQVDIVGLDIDLHFSQTTLASRHFQVVTALQEKAQDTQGALLADLEARKNAGQIEGYTSYWLINAVMVRGQEDAIRALAARQDVSIAEVDMVPELIEPRINESAITSDRGIGIAPGIAAVGARRVWDELGIRGEGTLIGSLDTGVMGNHEALADRWRGNFAPHDECWLDVLDNGSTTPVDNHGHGTHTTGTMTGLAPDDTIGISPGSLWIAANAIDQGANAGFDSDILDCLEFFTDPDGDPSTLDDVPDVVQNSWGVNENFTGYVDCDSRWWAAIDACEAAGVVLCWSAGNEGPTSQSLRSPGDRATTLYNCFSVGSTQHYAPYAISSFSSRGPAGPNCGPAENRIKPEISAPGSDIYSSTRDGGYQGGWDGTSMAGPHVAGVVALMRSANPNLDVITIKQILMETAVDLGTPGEDNTYGHGFLDAYAAVLAVADGLGYLEGTLVNTDTGVPVEGAQIAVVDGYQTAVTDADGRFDLTLPEGEVEFVVTRFGYLEGNFSATIVEDETTTQMFYLDPAPVVALSGVVYLPSGEVAAGAVVEPLDVPVDAVVADIYGNYSLDLPTGLVYDVQASVDMVGRVIETVDMQAAMTLDFYLLPLGAHAEVSPEAFDVTMPADQQATRQLVVTNNGADPLVWRLAAEEGSMVRTAPVVTPQPTLEVAKDAVDPRAGQSPVAGYGGPDNYGYIWIDSNEPGGPVYNWFDISSLGETVGNSDDETYGPFNMGFPFSYYDGVYSALSICTNGFITFQDTNEDPYTNQPLPNTDQPNLMVCPMWDDLNPSNGGDIYRYYDAANARYIVQWDNVPHYFDEGNYTFQVMIYASGLIVMQYQELSDVSSCTVGIENATGTDGLQVVYNSAYLEENMAIQISAGSQVPWLDYAPLSGVVGANETVNVDVYFDSTGLALDTYLATLTFSSNDGDMPSMVIPVSLTVGDGTTGVGDTPVAFGLQGAVPNPFNPQTTIHYSLPVSGHVDLRLYDIQGRLVRSLVDGVRSSGANQARWDGRDDAGRSVASGTYFARLRSGGDATVKSMVLVR